MKPNLIPRWTTACRRLLPAAASAALALAALSSDAADVSLTANDTGAGNIGSYNNAGNWSDHLAPHSGANYYTGPYLMRSTYGGSAVFAGDSLTLGPAVPGNTSFRLKATSGSTLTINNCTNAGGIIDNGNGGATYFLSGNFWYVSAGSAFGLAGDVTRTTVLTNLNLYGSAIITNGPITTISGGEGLGTIVYACNATGFTGPLLTSLGVTLRAYSQTNLGGVPSSFNAAQFSLDNGTFAPLASMAFNNANSGVTIASGGGTFNIGAGLNFTNANPLAGAGTLTKSGAGTLVQGGSSAGFTGNTTVNAGTLTIGAGASLAGAPVLNVAGGATLDVTAAGLTMSAGQQLTGAGTINGNVTDANNTTIDADGPGGAVTNLTFNNNLTLVNGGKIGVAFGATTNDVLIVNGNLSPSGVTYVNVVTAPPGGFVNGQTFTVIKVNGTLGGSAANFSIPSTLQTRQVFSIVYDTVNKLVKLQVAGNQPANLVWQGDVTNGLNNVWDVNTTPDWLNGVNSDVYYDLDAVSFTDAGTNLSGTINQPTLDVTVNPKSVTFNSSNNYTLSSLTGAGVIAGTGGLTKSGTGTLTLQTTNTYTGGTLVNGGILAVNNPGALGNPSSSLITVTNGGAFDISGQGFLGSLYVLASGSGVATNQGAIFASAGMGCSIGCTPKGFRNLRLTGNAAIGEDGGIWQIGIDGNANGNAAGVGAIDGKGFSLTKVGNNTLVVECTNASALSQFLLLGGTTLVANTGGNPFGTTASLVFSNAAAMEFWDNYANSGVTLANPIIIGPGGGVLRNNHGPYYNHAFYNTFSGNVTLNDTLTILNTCTFGGAPNNVPTWGQMNFSGVISGTNGLVCVGPMAQYSGANHTVTFSGNNTYSGPTLVSNYVTLQTTTFNTNGGSYTLVDYGALDVIPVTGKPTLTMSNLTLDMQFMGPPSLSFARLTSMPTNALIYATNLTVTTSCDIIPPKSGYAIGQYPLIKYEGTIGGVGFGGFTLYYPPRGVALNLVDNTANHTIDLQVTSIGMIWTGINSSDWDIGLTQNWFNPQYLIPDYYQDGDTVVFNDTATNYVVTIPAIVKPTGITVDTATNYFFGGANGIGGTASLLKTGPGTLTVANSNNIFTGGTIIKNGTLKLADLSYAYPYPGGALNDNLGVVTVTGGGTLDVNGVQVPNYQSFGPDGYNVSIVGAGVNGNGALVNNGGNNDNADPGYVTLTGDATVGGTGDVNVRHGVAPKLSSQSGAYTLTKVGPGQFRVRYLTEVTTNFGNINILQGIVSFESSSTNGFGDKTKTIFVGNGGGFALGTASAPFNKQIICSNGATLYGYNTTGNVIASPVNLVDGNVTINANYYNALTFSNVLSGAGGITVSYNSLATFAAANTYSGNTVVVNCNSGGGSVLRLVGSGSIAASTNITLQGIVTGQAVPGALDVSGRTDGTLTLVNNQTLRGDNGSYVRGNVVATSGTTITPGGLGNIQSMTFSNALNFQSGSTCFMDISKDAGVLTNDSFAVIGALTCNGTLNVNKLGADALGAGDSFKLFTAGTVSSMFNNIVPATPGAGLLWDTTGLTNGVLSVKLAIVPQPHITSIGLDGSGHWVLQGTNGTPGGSYSVLSSTNVAAPLMSWLTNALGTFSGTGTFSNAIPVNAALPENFYLLRVP